jgi:hypothetical protein
MPGVFSWFGRVHGGTPEAFAEPSFPVINPLIMAMPSGEAVRLAAKASTPASFTFFSLLLF